MTARPTAFARVPRGANKGTQKAPDLIRIDANFLDRFEKANLSNDLATIMTKTDSKLSIEINPQSAVGYSLKNETGKVIADKADIKRIQTMSASITKERKAALGEEVGAMTKFTLAAFVQQSRDFAGVNEIQRFHKSFLSVYRTVNTQFQTISKNLNAIEAIATETDAADEVKNIFLEMGKRISRAVGLYLYHRANLAEDGTAEKLNKYLFDAHVPIFIFEKLSTAVIQTAAQGFEISHLLFPKDPTKGAYLTFKELRNQPFRENMMGLLSGSQMVVRMALDDELIRLMTNIPVATPVDNFDEVGSVATKMANTPFFLIPNAGLVEPSEVFNFLAKNGVRGVTWASGTVLTPPDLLKYYGTIAKRLSYGLLTRPQSKAALLQAMFEGFTYSNESDQQDIFAQLKAWSQRPGATFDWFSKVRRTDPTAQDRLLLNRVFSDVVMISPNHAIAERFGAMLRGTPLQIPVGSLMTGALIYTEVKNLAITMRNGRIDAANIIGARISLAEGKKNKAQAPNRAGTQERSRLSANANLAVHELRTRNYAALAARMQIWFRLFLDETVQDAVAAVFLARLESFLATPLEVSREERLALMEPGEPSEENLEDVVPEEIQETPINPDEE